MSLEWFILRGEQTEGPISSSELKLLADQRKISPETLVKQGISGPWIPAGTIEGLFVEYHGAKPSPTTGSPPPVRYVKPREWKKAVLALPPTLAQSGLPSEKGPPGTSPAQPAMAGTAPEVKVSSLPPEGAASVPSVGAQSSSPSVVGQPTPGSSPQPPAASEDLVSPIWYLQTPDGQQYGPVSKHQLDQWAAEGRVGNDCWLWRAGWPDWQGAGSVYGGLGQPLAPAESPGSAAQGEPKPAEQAWQAGGPGRRVSPSFSASWKTEESAGGLADPQAWIGRTLGHYELLHSIGRGPSGLVYKARHIALDRLVAVRLIPTGGDRGLFEQLSEGLRGAVRLTHPHLVEVHDMGDMGGMVYVAMELMEGGSLAEWIQRSGRVPVPAAMGIFHQVALALRAVHEAGLLHRDIKPSNILFTSQGVTKLSDLGLAALTEARLRGGPSALGSTAYYMAPELFQGQPASVRSDLYSLGATFYHALCGRAPGEGISPEELVGGGGRFPVQSIGGWVPGLPPTMAALIDRLLLKDPAGRFSSVGEVLEMFEQMGRRGGAALGGRGKAASSSLALAGSGGPLAASGQAPAGEEGPPVWWSKILSSFRSLSWKTWVVGAGAAVAFLWLVIFLFLLFGR